MNNSPKSSLFRLSPGVYMHSNTWNQFVKLSKIYNPVYNYAAFSKMD